MAPYEGGVSDSVVCGNIGPKDLSDKVIAVYDKSLIDCVDMVVGANKEGYHYRGFNVARDLQGATFSDIAKVKDGDVCPVCGGKLRLENGIEIGNIFQLGTKYSAAMGMSVHAEDGTSFAPIMGCYGIGVGRAIASVAEESGDDKGLVLPVTIAPWQLHLCALRTDKAELKDAADKLYNELVRAGVDVLYDDRDCAAGIKFNDADLMGMPIRAVISPRTLEAGEIEVKLRKGGDAFRVSIDSAIEQINSIIAQLKEEIERDL